MSNHIFIKSWSGKGGVNMEKLIYKPSKVHVNVEEINNYIENKTKSKPTNEFTRAFGFTEKQLDELFSSNQFEVSHK